MEKKLKIWNNWAFIPIKTYTFNKLNDQYIDLNLTDIIVTYSVLI